MSSFSGISLFTKKKKKKKKTFVIWSLQYWYVVYKSLYNKIKKNNTLDIIGVVSKSSYESIHSYVGISRLSNIY